jgi:NAD(P)-dependent dehydrogenase (short-subunit alcohol dehydrogenase family)
VLVVGAGGGIGSVVAERFAAAGALVIAGAPVLETQQIEDDPQAAAARQAALERVVRAALVHLPASKAAAVAAAATGATREQAYALAVRFAKAGTQAEQPAGD